MDKARVVPTSYEDTRLPRMSLIYGDLRLCSADIELSRSAKASIALSRKIDAQVAEDFDYVLIDSPPDLGLLTINGLLAATHYIIPVEANSFDALLGLAQLERTIGDVQEANESLKMMGALVTMFKRNTKISRGIIQEIHKYFNAENVLKTLINSNTAIEQATHPGKSIFEYDGGVNPLNRTDK